MTVNYKSYLEVGQEIFQFKVIISEVLSSLHEHELVSQVLDILISLFFFRIEQQHALLEVFSDACELTREVKRIVLLEVPIENVHGCSSER